MQKLYYIDALRGIAILGVIMVHVSLHSLTGISLVIAQLGAKGVQLFYFISAFTLFLSSNNTNKRDLNPNTSFFIRRIFRIAPLYYIGIIYYGLCFPLYTHQKIDFIGIGLNLLFLHGFSAKYINSIVPGGWSIAIEMLFYLFVPLLVLKINSLNKAITFLVFSIFIKAAFNGILISNPLNINYTLWSNYIYWYLPNQVPSFAFGIIYYFITVQKNIKQEIMSNIKPYGLLGTLLLMLLLLDKFILRIDVYNLDFLFGILFIFIALLLRKFEVRVIVNPITQLIGNLSFSMYLIHFAVIYWYYTLHFTTKVDTSKNTILFFFDYLEILGGTVIISYFSHKYIEMKFQLVGKLIIQTFNKRTKIDAN